MEEVYWFYAKWGICIEIRCSADQTKVAQHRKYGVNLKEFRLLIWFLFPVTCSGGPRTPHFRCDSYHIVIVAKFVSCILYCMWPSAGTVIRSSTRKWHLGFGFLVRFGYFTHIISFCSGISGLCYLMNSWDTSFELSLVADGYHGELCRLEVSPPSWRIDYEEMMNGF